MTKAELRAKIVVIRDALSSEDVSRLSAAIRKRALALPELKAARSVFTYVSEGIEVDTHALIIELLRQGKVVAVPRIKSKGVMDAHRIARLDDLVPGRFGILAPKASNPLEGPPDVVVCPAVALTPKGERLGRGGAYYDRYLAGHSGSLAVALGYEFQIVGEIPADDTPVGAGDQRVAVIVTELRMIRPAATDGRPGEGQGRPAGT